MTGITPHQFWIAIAAVAVFFFVIWEPEAAKGALATIWRLGVLGIAGALAYQSYDSFDLD